MEKANYHVSFMLTMLQLTWKNTPCRNIKEKCKHSILKKVLHVEKMIIISKVWSTCLVIWIYDTKKPEITLQSPLKALVHGKLLENVFIVKTCQSLYNNIITFLWKVNHFYISIFLINIERTKKKKVSCSENIYICKFYIYCAVMSNQIQLSH